MWAVVFCAFHLVFYIIIFIYFFLSSYFAGNKGSVVCVCIMEKSSFIAFVPRNSILIGINVLIGIKLWHSQNKFQQQNTDSINGKKKFKTKIRKMINKTNNSENIGLNDSIVVEQQQNNNSKFKHLSKQFSEMSVNETHSINEKTSKDFEKARQSRRDVVNMLCNYFCFFCLNFKLIEMFCY